MGNGESAERGEGRAGSTPAAATPLAPASASRSAAPLHQPLTHRTQAERPMTFKEKFLTPQHSKQQEEEEEAEQKQGGGHKKPPAATADPAKATQLSAVTPFPRNLLRSQQLPTRKNQSSPPALPSLLPSLPPVPQLELPPELSSALLPADPARKKPPASKHKPTKKKPPVAIPLPPTSSSSATAASKTAASSQGKRKRKQEQLLPVGSVVSAAAKPAAAAAAPVKTTAAASAASTSISHPVAAPAHSVDKAAVSTTFVPSKRVKLSKADHLPNPAFSASPPPSPSALSLLPFNLFPSAPPSSPPLGPLHPSEVAQQCTVLLQKAKQVNTDVHRFIPSPHARTLHDVIQHLVGVGLCKEEYAFHPSHREEARKEREQMSRRKMWPAPLIEPLDAHRSTEPQSEEDEGEAENDFA